jgi:hypothetical protein
LIGEIELIYRDQALHQLHQSLRSKEKPTAETKSMDGVELNDRQANNEAPMENFRVESTAEDHAIKRDHLIPHEKNSFTDSESDIELEIINTAPVPAPVRISNSISTALIDRNREIKKLAAQQAVIRRELEIKEKRQELEEIKRKRKERKEERLRKEAQIRAKELAEEAARLLEENQNSESLKGEEQKEPDCNLEDASHDSIAKVESSTDVEVEEEQETDSRPDIHLGYSHDAEFLENDSDSDIGGEKINFEEMPATSTSYIPDQSNFGLDLKCSSPIQSQEIDLGTETDVVRPFEAGDQFSDLLSGKFELSQSQDRDAVVHKFAEPFSTDSGIPLTPLLSGTFPDERNEAPNDCFKVPSSRPSLSSTLHMDKANQNALVKPMEDKNEDNEVIAPVSLYLSSQSSTDMMNNSQAVVDLQKQAESNSLAEIDHASQDSNENNAEQEPSSESEIDIQNYIYDDEDSIPEESGTEQEEEDILEEDAVATEEQVTKLEDFKIPWQSLAKQQVKPIPNPMNSLIETEAEVEEDEFMHEGGAEGEDIAANEYDPTTLAPEGLEPVNEEAILELHMYHEIKQGNN